MGAIQNKRGSVRGAPPAVYAPFIIPGDSEECDEELEATAFDFFVLTLIGFVLYAFCMCWKAIRFFIF